MQAVSFHAGTPASAVAKRKHEEVASPPTKKPKLVMTIHTETETVETAEDLESSSTASGVTKVKSKKTTKSTRSSTVSQTFDVLLH